MKTTKTSWTVKKFGTLVRKGELRFDYPIQRAGGQWLLLQKSLLIHSLIADYPIPPILVLAGAGEEKDHVLDGKQRITNILDFTSGVKDKEGKYPSTAYKLDDETPSIIETDNNGEEFEVVLAGKYFDELDSEIQDDLLGFSLSATRLEEATDEEIEELFYRWNNGTSLTKQQKARSKMGVGKAKIIDTLVKHPFIQSKAKFTALQRRRSDDEAVILQTMMLLTGYEIPSNGFVADNILKYASEMRGLDVSEGTNALTDALDYANESLKEQHPLLKKLHLPTLLLVAKEAYDKNVDMNVFSAWVEDFDNALNGRTRDKALVKTNYKNFTGAGSVKRDRVLGRKKAMLDHFKEFVEKYEPIVEEPKAVVEPETNVENNEPNEPKKNKKGVVTKPVTVVNPPEPNEPTTIAEVHDENKDTSVEENPEKKEKLDADEIFAGIDEVLK